MTPELAAEPITRAYLVGSFRQPVVLTGDRIREFIEITEPVALARARRAIRITGVATTSRFQQAGEFLGQGFGRFWFAEYAA